ncbi:S8 family serine peptidase [Runella sp.]|uniref:S8 family peptidase n=1 Tax=Runella sp. TaxID=1960881 RepID=UPI0030172712
MSPPFFFATKLTDHRSVMLFAQPVYRRAEQLKTLLRNRLSATHAELLSNPTVSAEALSGFSPAVWNSDYLSTKAQRLSSLTGNEKEKALTQLSKLLADIDELIIQLKSEADPMLKQSADLLDKATQIPGDDFVFVEGDKITLVLWGFYVELEKERHFTIRQYLKNQPISTNSNIILPIQTPPITTLPQSSKRNWWLLALLLLLLLLVGLWWCHKPYSVLPPDPSVFVPIDPAKIIEKPNDPFRRQIVGNRLNIYLDKAVQLEKFANKLIVENRQDSLQIIYYEPVYNLLQLQFPMGQIEKWRQKLRTYPEIKLIFNESVFRSEAIPNDPAFGTPKSSYHFEKINTYPAWDLTQGDTSVVVAVIDNGFDLSHPELKDKVVAPWNVITHSNSINAGTSASLDHGTHVAALAVGTANNAQGGSGIAPRSRLMPIQISDDSNTLSTLAIINAIFYAIKNGADIINLSLGQHFPPEVASQIPIPVQEQMADSLGKDEEEVWNTVFKYAVEKNIVVVQAAGNDNVSASLDAMKRSSYAITVAATDYQNKRADFSNFGKYTTVSAPGVEIFSALPQRRFAPKNGTSMAAPIVAGAVALIKATAPELTFEQIKDILIKTAIPVTSAPDKEVGPLIQLAEALNAIPPKDPCKAKVDSLEAVIRKLRSDTAQKMKMPKSPRDCNFAIGAWKSNTPLINTRTEEPIELQFDFRQGCKGQITFIEQNNTCTANVTLKIQGDKLLILQQQEAPCRASNIFYIQHEFSCTADEQGNAQCTGTSNNQVVTRFTMIKQ